ncbi:MAG: hypothetical protein ACI8QS_001385 [Planctomycetota bacterium]|jgi:hypothetical protein
MEFKHPLTIHYHRDFDGMVAAAVLASILREKFDENVEWESVNYDQRKDWDNFQRGRRFAIVDFHFHPKAEYWFDHHPTTFLNTPLRQAYAPSDRWAWDETSPSCPPLILRHAKEHWDYEAPERFIEMAHWSDIIDAAKFESVEQALFADDPALRISRSLMAAPEPDWTNTLVEAMIDGTLAEVADREDVERSFQRAAKNRDKALQQFPPTILTDHLGVLLYDTSSNKIRRERFASFYHFPKAVYAVGVIPTRAGYHVTAGQNPWNNDGANSPAHIGNIMETFGGGGHRAVGGANANGLEDAREKASHVAELLRDAVEQHRKDAKKKSGADGASGQ